MRGIDAIAALTERGFTDDLASPHNLTIGVKAIPFVRRLYWRSYDRLGRIVVDAVLLLEEHSYRPEDVQLMEPWNDAQVRRAEEEATAFEIAQSFLIFAVDRHLPGRIPTRLPDQQRWYGTRPAAKLQ